MIFSSKGFKHATQSKGAALEAALLKASEGGKLPIVVDTSPCLAQIKGDLTDGALKCAPGALGSGNVRELCAGQGFACHKAELIGLQCDAACALCTGSRCTSPWSSSGTS